MKNLFDDFMEELRRRQEALAAGRDPDAPDADPDRTDRDADGEDRPDDRERADGTDHDGSDADPDDDQEPQPVPIRPASGAGGRGRPPAARRTRVGGPDDGAPRRRDRARGIGIAVVILGLVAFFALAGFILDLITDAIWFRSVGYDSVFFTRVETQAALFIGVFVVVLVFLGFNVRRRRLAPPPDPDRAGRVGEFAARLRRSASTTAASAAGDGPISREPGSVRAVHGPSRSSRRHADLVPVARWG